jgi:hypothetical protein
VIGSGSVTSEREPIKTRLPHVVLNFWHKVQPILVNGFYLISINAYPDVFCMQHGPLWKLNLLHVFEHNTHKCVLHMYATIAVCNERQFPVLLRRRMHYAAQRRGTFQGIQCGMFIKL